MALCIDTFSNSEGGFTFFKAAGHPASAPQIKKLLNRISKKNKVAIYDPLGFANGFFEIYPSHGIAITDVYVQDLNNIGKQILGCVSQPITNLIYSEVDFLLVIAFDADKFLSDIQHLVPSKSIILSLDEVRLSDNRLTNNSRYLDSLNFATNFAWFRDIKGGLGHNLHTRLVTANYWHRYGSKNITFWLILFDDNGEIIAEWDQTITDSSVGITIDSSEIRERFKLNNFTGQLLVHVIGVKGHDIVKYALDTYSDNPLDLSCTHDSNAWPADFYAGIPAPNSNEKVIIWIQNSHPTPIPAGAVSLNLMGYNDHPSFLNKEIPPFGTYPLSVSDLLPDAVWPQQLELAAGKHFTRPRYEIVKGCPEGISKHRLAHANIERADLTPNPDIEKISNLMGKGFILPAPILPTSKFLTTILPTPMATTQLTLPITALIYNYLGKKVAEFEFGEILRTNSLKMDSDIIGDCGLSEKAGHIELVYNFSVASRGVDGWLHALLRYEDKVSGHIAESSFGAHIFNTVLTWNGEPQSYSSNPPGLTTRLFLRTAKSMGIPGAAVGGEGANTFCHLIYPASTPWHSKSETDIILYASDGKQIASHRINITCGGSKYFLISDIFDENERKTAFQADQVGNGYIIIRDTTCRLFGYHGLVSACGKAFSLDHMFGF